MLHWVMRRGARASPCLETRVRKRGPLSIPAALMYSAMDSAALKWMPLVL
jgi:hypothetical protein